MFIPDPGFGFVFASRIRILYSKVKKHLIRIRNISGLDPDLDSPKSRFRIHQIAIRNSDPYSKEPKNRFRGIYSARLGVDSWAPYKVYKYGLLLYHVILYL
jgi:hypothetical protein